jgi:hypothetical protein
MLDFTFRNISTSAHWKSERSTPRPLEMSEFRISNIFLYMSLEQLGRLTGDIQGTEAQEGAMTSSSRASGFCDIFLLPERKSNCGWVQTRPTGKQLLQSTSFHYPLPLHPALFDREEPYSTHIGRPEV